MGRRSVRRAPAFGWGGLLFLLSMGVVSGVARPARADRHDLQLLNLCDSSGGVGCSWVSRAGGGTTVTLDPEATSRFRSLMSELGVAIAPRLQTPADTLGFAGFQFSAELGMTQISRDKPFWNGVQAFNGRERPDGWLTTMGLYARKGMWFPVPALEWGVGAVNILQSGMWSVEGYVKLAIQEGFHNWPLPSAAVRAGFSQLVGTDQVTLTVTSIDVLISKAFSLAGTTRIEPFAGWDFLFIDARSGVIDATPDCDAFLVQHAASDAAARAACPGAVAGEAGTWSDLGGNFTFPNQDVITRNRIYGGVKLKLAAMFLAGQWAIVPAGKSRDGRSSGNGARDDSATQQAVSISAGFDF